LRDEKTKRREQSAVDVVTVVFLNYALVLTIEAKNESSLQPVSVCSVSAGALKLGKGTKNLGYIGRC